MAYCRSCGQEVGNANFCPKCGAAQDAAAATPPGAIPASSANPTEGLAENVAGFLCYLLAWITGIIFLLIDKRPWVRFQAAQSVVVFGGLTVIRIALSIIGAMMGGVVGFGLMGMLELVISLVSVVLWILLMVKAFQHQTFRVPIAAGIADGIAK